MPRVRITIELDLRAKAKLRIDDPVFGNGCHRIVSPFLYGVPFRIVRADPPGLRPAKTPPGCAGSVHRATQPDPVHGSGVGQLVRAMGQDEGYKQFLQQREDSLMFAYWHWQHLERAVGEFNQLFGLVGQAKTLLLGPETLDRQQIKLKLIRLPHQLQFRVMKVYSHHIAHRLSRSVSLV